MSRFVVLHHVVNSGEPDLRDHFDLMVEPPSLPKEADSTSGLWTWRIASFPFFRSQIVEQIAHHRWQYLDYEGEISGGRGFVSRVASGPAEWIDAGESSLRFGLRFDFISPKLAEMTADLAHEEEIVNVQPSLKVFIQMQIVGAPARERVGIEYRMNVARSA